MSIKSVEDVKKFAMEHYNEGGDIIVECWSDEQIQRLLDETETPKKAKEDLLDLFDGWNDERCDSAYYARGEMDEDEYRKMQEAESSMAENEEDNEDFPRDSAEDFDPYFKGTYTEDGYIPSACCGDYSPSCPWNAPGMSVRDFI